jgi:hypothetical protein
MATSLPTVDEIKAALGIESSDVSKDDAIESMLEATIALIESYLGRGIQSAPEVQDFEPPEMHFPSLLLYRFPVSVVNSVSQDARAISGWRIRKSDGVLQWRPRECYVRRACCGEIEAPVTVDYIGGYGDGEWPANLVEAVMRAFYIRWNATGGTGNLSEVVNAPGNNRSVSVDGLTITRDSSMYAGEAFAGQAVPPELTSVAAMLEPFRSRTMIGV